MGSRISAKFEENYLIFKLFKTKSQPLCEIGLRKLSERNFVGWKMKGLKFWFLYRVFAPPWELRNGRALTLRNGGDAPSLQLHYRLGSLLSDI